VEIVSIAVAPQPSRAAEADKAATIGLFDTLALTEEELLKLLDAACRRPLHEAMLIRRGSRQGQATAEVRPAVREELEALGRERALICATLATTGLRKGELASLTVGQAFLDSARPYLRLCAADAKNRKEAFLPLRRDVAREIGLWVNERLETRQRAARDAGEAHSRCPAAR